MSLEEILHTFNSPPSKLEVIGKDYLNNLVTLNVYSFIVKCKHLEHMFASAHYFYISKEAIQIIQNRENLKTLEAYLNF